MPRSCFNRNFPSSFLPSKSSHPNYLLTHCKQCWKKPLFYLHFPKGFPVHFASLLPRKKELLWEEASSLGMCRRRRAHWPRKSKGRCKGGCPTARGTGSKLTVPRSLCHHFTFGTRGIRPWQIQGRKPTTQLVVETETPV